MDPVKSKANYSRLCQLLVDKGSNALRVVFHGIHPPSTLTAVLNANKSVLKKIRYSVIKASQWNLLFPASGSPDSKNFDVTLLTILLRNMCGLHPPATGWNVMPPTSDTSISANITRIKIFRNEVYGHRPSAQLDDTAFETFWQEISNPLVKLGIPQQDIDELKEAPLSPEEESYVKWLKEWKELEDDVLSKLDDVEKEVKDFRNEMSASRKAIGNANLTGLAMFEFTRKIEYLTKNVQDDTSPRFLNFLNLLNKFSKWKTGKKSKALVRTRARDLRFGKSVLSVKLCESYYRDFRNSDSRNLYRVLQSLASQTCENFNEFCQKLSDVLCREYSRDSLSEAIQWQGISKFVIKLGTFQQSVDDLGVDPIPGIEKSVFCAMVCKPYQRSGLHTTVNFYECHLGCKNTKQALQSLARHMCVNIEGLRNTPCEVLFHESLSDHFPVLSHCQLHNLVRRDTLLIAVDEKPNANRFSSSEEDSVGLQRSKNRRDKKPKRKIFMDFNVSSIKTGKQRKRIRGHIRYSTAKKKMIVKHEKMSEEHALKAGNSLHSEKPLDVMKCSRVKELEDENFSLKKQLKSLQLKYEEISSKLEKTAKENEENKSEHFRQIFQIVKELKDENCSQKKEIKSLQFKNEELLFDLGQIIVEKTAMENGERKSEHFRQIFNSSLGGDKRSGTSNSRDDISNNDFYQQSSDPNGFLRPPVTNRNSNLPIVNASVVGPASSSEHPINEVKTFVQKKNYQVDNNEKFMNNENERVFHEKDDESASTVRVNSDQQAGTTQNTPSIQSGEQSSGGEETNHFRGNHDQASTSRNGYDDLSFSVQQHDSGRESISLSNVPPNSVATTLYNNYKFLLLSLAQNLLLSDVAMLQDWAAQNFSINNPRNATDILLQLDQKGVINASDLHQLSDFFESIIRFDLVHIIDAFLLGDYNLLRQSQASKKNTESLVQNQGCSAILRNPGFLNSVSTREFSINTNRTLGTCRNPANNHEAQNSLPQTQRQSLRNFSDTANSTHFVRSLINQPTTSTQLNPYKSVTEFDSVRMAEVAVVDGPVTCKSIVLFYIFIENTNLYAYYFINKFDQSFLCAAFVPIFRPYLLGIYRYKVLHILASFSKILNCTYILDLCNFGRRGQMGILLKVSLNLVN